MRFFHLPNGHLVVPVPVEVNGVIGETYVEINQDDPEYADWARFFGTPWEIRTDSNEWDVPEPASSRRSTSP